MIDNRSRGILVGYFTSQDSTEYKTFSKVAKALSEECSFIAGFGDASEKERVTGDNIMFYDVEHGSAPVSEAVFLGALNNYDLVFKWAHDKCIPLVREITFENGEELTEEGKPFLILFHTSEDTQSLKYFQNEISRSLVGEEVIHYFLKIFSLEIVYFRKMLISYMQIVLNFLILCNIWERQWMIVQLLPLIVSSICIYSQIFPWFIKKGDYCSLSRIYTAANFIENFIKVQVKF